MLLPHLPTANVLVTVGPRENALPVFPSVFELTLVLASIGPLFYSSSLHIAHPELSDVPLLQICKEVFPEALELSIYKITMIV